MTYATPRRLRQASPPLKSIRGPNMILPSGYKEEEPTPTTFQSALEPFKPSPTISSYKSPQLYPTMAKNMPAYLKSPSIEGDLTANTSSGPQFSPNASITKNMRSKTTLKSRDFDFDLSLSPGKSRPNQEGGEVTPKGKSNAEINVNFEMKKVDGKSFVKDFLAKKIRANGTLSALLENDRIKEDHHSDMPYYSNIDTSIYTKNLLEKYQKEIPITEKDVLIPTHIGIAKSHSDYSNQKEEETSIAEIKLIKRISVQRERLPEVKTTKVLGRSPTEILYPNWSTLSVNGGKNKTPVRYATQVRDRSVTGFSEKNISGNESEIFGISNLRHRVGAQSMTNKQFEMQKKTRSYFDFDFDLDVARERTVRKAMAPERGNISKIIKKIESKRFDKIIF